MKASLQSSLQFHKFVDRQLGPEDLLEMSRYVRSCLRDATLDIPTLVASATSLGTLSVVTKDDIKLFAWRMAANVETLSCKTPVIPWVLQKYPEWMALQVVDYKLVRNAKGLTVSEYTFRVLSGTAAGMLVKKRLTRKACRMLARQIGFPSRRKQRSKKSVPRYKEFGDLVGCRLLGLFDAEHSVNTPGFWHMSCTGGMKTYNRKLLKDRTRKFAFKCPMDYTHPCNKCPIGYDQCPVATHPRTYELQHCDECGEENWFDTKLSGDMCVSCMTKYNLRSNQ